jgi:hypothetical protein
MKDTKNQSTTVMQYRGEHVLHKVVDGCVFIGLATIFNTLQIKNILPSDVVKLKPLKVGERPKPWTRNYLRAFAEIPKDVLIQITIQ